MASVAKRRWTHGGVEREAWIVRYLDPLGVHRQKTFPRKKDADRYKAEIEIELGDGTHISPKQSALFSEAVPMFLEDVDARVAIGALRPTTGYNYHCAFRQALVPAFGDRRMLQITSGEIESWYLAVIRSNRMTAATANRRIWFMKALFAFAIRRGWARRNPADEALKALGRPRENRIETFSLDQMRQVIATANQRRYKGRQRSHDMMQLAVNLAAFCGVRWGEIFGLTVNDVDLKERVLHIRHSLDGFGELQEPKTKAGIRDVVMPTHIAELLTAYIARYPIKKNKAGIIFASSSGTPMVATNFRQCAWLPLLRRAGIKWPKGKPLHFHALRHFAVSWMIDNGWPITDVQEMVGHANPSITLQVYAHSVKSRKQSAEAVQALADNLLNQPVTQHVVALIPCARLSHEPVEQAIAL